MYLSSLDKNIADPPIVMSDINYCSDSEAIYISGGHLTLESTDKTVVAFIVKIRGGRSERFLGSHSNGRVSASIKLNGEYFKFGTYDVFCQRAKRKPHRFGMSFTKNIHQDKDRLLGVCNIPIVDIAAFLAPYVTYSRAGLSIIIAKDHQKIQQHVFDLLFARITHAELLQNKLTFHGEFAVSGVASSACKVSMIVRVVDVATQVVTKCNLISSPELHKKYAFGTSDYYNSAFECVIDLDTLADSGLVTGRRFSFHIHIESPTQSFEKPVLTLPTDIERPQGLIKNTIPVHLEKHPESGRAYLAYDNKYSIDVIGIKKISRLQGGKMLIEGSFAIFGIDGARCSAKVACVQRHGGLQFSFPANTIIDPPLPGQIVETAASGHSSAFTSVIDIQQMSLTCFRDDRFVDFFLEVNLFGITMRRRIKVSSSAYIDYSGEYLHVYKNTMGQNDVAVYLTRGTSFLALSLRERLKEDGPAALIKESLAIFLNKVLPKRHDEPWILYETYSGTAQDNSFYLFKWLRENVPEKAAYYVIRSDSNDLRRLEPYLDNVCRYYSIRHLMLMLRASLFVSAQGRFHAYKFRPLKSRFKDIVMSKRLVFLQHGVTAFKKSTFKRNDPSGGANLVMAVSEAEKNIIVKHWGYKPEEVVVAGFSRFDELIDKSKGEKPVILVMPTWRSWLEDVDQATFDQSDFATQYRDLLDKLEGAAPDSTIKFYIHIKLSKYIQQWGKDYKRVQIVLLGEQPVNEMLMEASALLTDYSSVAWDFLYMNKPTVFFHFDSKKYEKYTGSFIDFDKNLFGPRAFDADQAVTSLLSAVRGDASVDNSNYFKYHDKSNSLRIYRSIISRFGP